MDRGLNEHRVDFFVWRHAAAATGRERATLGLSHLAGASPLGRRHSSHGDNSADPLRSSGNDGRGPSPANALGALAGKAHLKYCEVKAVIGGTTAIRGSAKM